MNKNRPFITFSGIQFSYKLVNSLFNTLLNIKSDYNCIINNTIVRFIIMIYFVYISN